MGDARHEAQRSDALTRIVSSKLFYVFVLMCVGLLTALLCSCSSVNEAQDGITEESAEMQKTEAISSKANDSHAEERRVHVKPADTYTIINTKSNQRFEETPEYAENYDYNFDKECADISFNEELDTIVVFKNNGADIDGDGAAFENGCLAITKAGTYVLRGDLIGGSVMVDAGKEDNVHIVFDGVTIKSKEGPCVYVKKCDDCLITLVAGTTNVLEDTKNYPQEDSSQGANATLFCSADLTLNGEGKLYVVGNYNHAISSKDDLIVMNGTYDITSQHDGFHGRDSVRIFDGTYDINVLGDGIDATNADDDEKGYVCLNGGSFAIQAGDDTVQAESHIRLAPGVSF